MSNDRSRIVLPGHGPIIRPGRQDRRATMAELNKMFAERIKYLEDLNGRQAANIKAMNQVFSDIATTLGTPVPKTAQEGIEALERMRARIIGLVEMEKRQTPDLK